MNGITEQSTVQSSPRISLADLGGEAVILDVESGNYYGLNKVGMFILKEIEQPRSVKGLVEVLATRFGIDTEVASKDTISFLEELQAASLVSVSDRHGDSKSLP